MEKKQLTFDGLKKQFQNLLEDIVRPFEEWHSRHYDTVSELLEKNGINRIKGVSREFLKEFILPINDYFQSIRQYNESKNKWDQTIEDVKQLCEREKIKLTESQYTEQEIEQLYWFSSHMKNEMGNLGRLFLNLTRGPITISNIKTPEEVIEQRIKFEDLDYFEQMEYAHSMCNVIKRLKPEPGLHYERHIDAYREHMQNRVPKNDMTMDFFIEYMRLIIKENEGTPKDRLHLGE